VGDWGGCGSVVDNFYLERGMTDRELLELAAKAAGVEGVAQCGHFYVPKDDYIFDPLTDDGDALRLAVKCMISIINSDGGVDVVLPNGKRIEAFGYGRYDATRRAIVRAAAEIGKGMK
jgi:hypothetical protein